MFNKYLYIVPTCNVTHFMNIKRYELLLQFITSINAYLLFNIFNVKIESFAGINITLFAKKIIILCTYVFIDAYCNEIPFNTKDINED